MSLKFYLKRLKKKVLWREKGGKCKKYISIEKYIKGLSSL
uniref:Uncharacterized protein n=1 Tax=Anguilla anguilla TaxID=7936 RepID=A0A0E9QEE4_ANGAN